MQKNQVARKTHWRARVVFALGVLPACAALLAGCGKGAKPEERRADPTAGGKAPRIVVIAGAPSANWNAARNGAFAAAKDLGAKIEWHAPKENAIDPKTSKPFSPLAQQEKWIEDATENNASGIAVAPMDATELVPPINKAGKKFVPTLAFDAPAYTKYKLTYVKNDDRALGVLAAQFVAKMASEENRAGANRVGIVQPKADSGGAQSAESFANELKENSPAMQIATIAPGAAAVPGVLLAPDEETSRAALNQLSKTVSSETIFIATGSSDDLIAGLKSGKVRALIVPDRYEMSYQSIGVILEYRKHNPPKNEIEIAPVLVTKENLQSAQSRRVLGLK